MPYRNVKHIFFDLDHTLWDFEKNSEEALGEIISQCREYCDFRFTIDEFLDVYKPLNVLMWKLYRENKITKNELRIRRFSDALDHFGISDLGVANHMAYAYVSISPRKTNLFPHAMEALEYLNERYKLHIITNGFEEIQFTKLKMSNIEVFFDEVITSEAIGVKKPDPLIFSYALEKTGAKPHESLMIGDNYEADILGALNSKMPAIYFNMDQKNELHANVRQITNLKELTSFL
ncbi:MAG: YjjG family noncanonical pyrimidine nucleotidase [Bacteroidota bacterium]